jgi:hypothetical protein
MVAGATPLRRATSATVSGPASGSALSSTTVSKIRRRVMST